MMRSFHWQWAGSAAAAWLVLAVWSALLPAEARAGCNHPWVKRGGHSGLQADRAVLDLSDYHTTIPEPESAPPADHPSPCAGGACSRGPNPPASSTVPIPTRIELWIDLRLAIVPSNPASVGFSPDRGRHHPARFIVPIERPPRTPVAS